MIRNAVIENIVYGGKDKGFFIDINLRITPKHRKEQKVIVKQLISLKLYGRKIKLTEEGKDTVLLMIKDFASRRKLTKSQRKKQREEIFKIIKESK